MNAKRMEAIRAELKATKADYLARRAADFESTLIQEHSHRFNKVVLETRNTMNGITTTQIHLEDGDRLVFVRNISKKLCMMRHYNVDGELLNVDFGT
jgi:hypothetical protein